MADVKICDRCNRVLTNKRTLIGLKPAHHKLRVELFKWRDAFRTACTDHDLCEKCTEQLVEFLEGKGIDAVKNT